MRRDWFAAILKALDADQGVSSGVPDSNGLSSLFALS